MKKTHWLRNTLIVLVVCGIIGTGLAAVLFARDGGKTSASASIQFSFKGAAEGKAPNGYAYDASVFTADEVLNEALAASGLAEKYTADQIRENLTVTGVYPERIVEQMTRYVSLLDTNADTTAAVTNYRATQYAVTLYRDFDSSISSGNLTGLLNQILISARNYFIKTYAVSIDPAEPIGNLSGYDYAQQLDAISESADQQKRYAEELAAMAPDFMADGKGFGDIAVRYGSLKSDIDRLNATITFNAVSKDQKRLQKRYELEILSQGYQLESLTEELKQIEAQVNAYEKDGIIYVSANGSLTQVGSDQDGTYDKLVEKRKEVTDQIAGINAKIELYQGRLNDMTGTSAKTDAEEGEEDITTAEKLTGAEKKALQAEVEKRIEALSGKLAAVKADFSAMMDAYTAQELNEKTLSTSAVKYNTPKILSGAFVMKVIKTAGPICAVGFMVCMMLLVISRRKEEKAGLAR